MPVAIYDNPATMCREAWQDGRMIAHISAQLMMSKGFNGHPSIPFYLNVGKDFSAGTIYGDAAAIATDSRTSATA